MTKTTYRNTKSKKPGLVIITIVTMMSLNSGMAQNEWSGAGANNTTGNIFRTGKVGLGSGSPTTALSISYSENQTNHGKNALAAIRISNTYADYFGRRSELQFGVGDDQNHSIGVISGEYNTHNGTTGGDLVFSTSPGTSPATMLERMRITSQGFLSVAGPAVFQPSQNGGAVLVNNLTGHTGFRVENSGQTKINMAIAGTSFLVLDAGNPRFQISNTGQTRIGAKASTNHANAMLMVDGKIVCKDLYVTANTDWPDFVFDTGYKLASLSEVMEYINCNKHLPGIPAAGDIMEKGINLAEMSNLQMKKIEELTLYILQLNAELEALKKQVSKTE